MSSISIHRSFLMQRNYSTASMDRGEGGIVVTLDMTDPSSFMTSMAMED